MRRIVLLFTTITALELLAFWTYRDHPLAQPGWFNALLNVIKGAMCWGGVEAARWLLRHSPVARRGAGDDWTRLWLWVGPPGGLLLVASCLLGWLVHQANLGRIAGPLVVAHAAAGALSWLLAAPWVVGDLFRKTSSSSLERKLIFAGVFTHLLGFAVYALVYPGKTVAPLTVLASLMFYYLIFYHVMVSLMVVWGLFRLWTPQLSEPAPQPTAEEMAEFTDLETGDH